MRTKYYQVVSEVGFVFGHKFDRLKEAREFVKMMQPFYAGHTLNVHKVLITKLIRGLK